MRDVLMHLTNAEIRALFSNIDKFSSTSESKVVAKDVQLNDVVEYKSAQLTSGTGFGFLCFNMAKCVDRGTPPERYPFLFAWDSDVKATVFIDGIQIDNLGEVTKSKKEAEKDKIFSYSIKIADFYYKDSAKNMSNRIIDETNIVNPVIKTISNTKYRVLLGPFNDIKKLEDSFNEIKSLKFENIEILKDV